MCGIAGASNDPDGVAVRTMAARLRHRGPDDEGVHLDPTGLAIATRRLAILDLAGGHQPLANEDGKVWVSFNGEIYNHRPLRELLQSRGHSFATECDTEVLVHLYEEYGERMVYALEGMFAFAIWDSDLRTLLLARDSFGEKPLFLHEGGGELAFASELTALLAARPGLRELDPAAVDAFFVLGYVPGPGTIVPSVRQLPPGSLYLWDQEARRGEERRWWSPPAATSTRLHEPRAGLAAEAARLFEDSVSARLIADVPVGVFLSGGIDSTLVTAAASRSSSRPVRTFTIGYDVGPFNETERARPIAARLGAEHHEVILTQEEVGRRAPALLASTDQPLADQALISLHALSEFARPLVTVALGGEGADELFGGYPRYRWLRRAQRLDDSFPGVARPLELLRRSPPGSTARRLGQRAAPAPLLERHLDWVTGGRRHLRDDLYGPRLAGVPRSDVLAGVEGRAGALDGEDPGRLLMRLDQLDYLPDDVLVKTDRSGMLVSLEIRSVYLHRGLAEFAASLDTSLHLGGRGKQLLHAILPPGMDTARGSGSFRKAAFRAPTAEWLRGSLAPCLRRQLETGSIYSEGWFDRGAAKALASRHLDGSRDHSDLLWPLLSLGLWVDRLYEVDPG